MAISLLAESSIRLVPDGTLILHIAIILIMVFVLNATLFKPINRILAEREARTRGRSGEAHDIVAKIEEMTSRYEQRLREARTEGYRLLEQGRAAALKERQDALGVIRQETSDLIATEKESIASQVAEARGGLIVQSRDLAAEIGSHILHRPISDDVRNRAAQDT